MRRRTIALALVAAALGGGWYALHQAMPGWYARRVYPLSYDTEIRSAAARHGVDPALVAAVIYQESGFDTASTSDQGARGLMQVLPSTAAQIARTTGGDEFAVEDLDDPAVNIRYGSWYLGELLDRYDGSRIAAVAAYNAGPGNVDRWLADAEAEGRRLTVDDLAFAETRAYVRGVRRMASIYRRAYPAELGLDG